jgi:hypothetical protein
MPPNQRQRAIEAATLLNNFILDLVVGTQALTIFDLPNIAPSVTHAVRVGLNRMAISHLVITLAKWTEFYRRYKAILPEDVRSECRILNEKITSRGIINFRNTVVGHILDGNRNRPLTSQEVDQRLEQILGGNHEEFFLWINNPQYNSFPHTVVSILEHVRDKLRSQYQLRDDEIL